MADARTFEVTTVAPFNRAYRVLKWHVTICLRKLSKFLRFLCGMLNIFVAAVLKLHIQLLV